MKSSLFFILLDLCIWHTFGVPCGNFPDQAQCQQASKCQWDPLALKCRCKDTVADFVFLIDGSGSIGPVKFDIQKSMVEDILAQSVPVNSGVGLILFSSGVTQVQTLPPRLPSMTDYINKVKAIQYPDGSTNMGEALRVALTYFSLSDRQNNFRIFLVTDGKPTGTHDPCQYKSVIANSPGLHVVILGVGAGFSKSAVFCLVQKEPNPDQWIIQIDTYSKTAFAKVLPQLDTQLCPDSVDLKITELKPLQHLNNTGKDGTVWFEFINNGLSYVPMNIISMRGLFENFLIGSSDTRQLAPGQPVVVYLDNGNKPNCLRCNCTRLSSFMQWCNNSYYIGCGLTRSSGHFCQIQAGWNTGAVTMRKWAIELLDNTGKAITVHNLHYDPAKNWPNITDGFTYALKKYADNNQNGRNWKQSCLTQGTPGAIPLKKCTRQCTVVQCRNNGDANATCSTTSNTCQCSAQYYYPESGTCLNLIAPKECNATLVKRAQGVYEVHFTWTAVPVPPNINYSGFIDNRQGGFWTLSNYHSATFDLTTWNNKQYYGSVQSMYRKVDVQGTQQLYTSRPPTPCRTKTSAPTPAPTQSPIVLPQLKVYVGGDICAQERCSCAYKSFDCVGPPIVKAVTIGASEFITLSRQPFDFQQEIIVEFNITGFGRRRLSAGSTVTTAAPSWNGTCNSTSDICPQRGYATIPPGQPNVRIPLNVRSAQFSTYNFRLTACVVGGKPCRLFYPSTLALTLSAPAASTALTTNQLPEWLWWLIGALILFLFLLALLAYQFWWKNRETSKNLDATQADLDHAIAENELGFAHDLDAGDVVFNPIATGVPGASNAPDFFTNEMAQRRGDAMNTRADVAVEKFQHREQFGQVAGPNKGNDLSQPLLS